MASLLVNWIEKNYQLGDEVHILSLLREVFGSKKYDLEYWNWLYSKEKNGLGSIINLAYDRGEVVGHYALILTEMIINGHIVIGAQSVDTAVSPHYRGQRIFHNLCLSTLKEAEVRKIPIVYGFTQTSGPAWKGFTGRLGWVHLGNVPRMIYVLNPRAVARHKYGQGFLSYIVSTGLKLFKSRHFEESKWSRKVSSIDIDVMSRFWNVIKQKTPIMISRTSRYLQWRYFDRPNMQYTMFVADDNEESVSGFMVVRFRHEEDFTRCTLVDFLSRGMNSADEHQVMKDLICYVLNYAVEAGADVVDGWIPHQYANDFKALGFASGTTNSGWIVHSSVLERSIYTNPTNYYLTMGDSDGG